MTGLDSNARSTNANPWRLVPAVLDMSEPVKRYRIGGAARGGQAPKSLGYWTRLQALWSGDCLISHRARN
jgi:hypothetical protein